MSQGWSPVGISSYLFWKFPCSSNYNFIKTIHIWTLTLWRNIFFIKLSTMTFINCFNKSQNFISIMRYDLKCHICPFLYYAEVAWFLNTSRSSDLITTLIYVLFDKLCPFVSCFYLCPHCFNYWFYYNKDENVHRIAFLERNDHVPFDITRRSPFGILRKGDLEIYVFDEVITLKSPSKQDLIFFPLSFLNHTSTYFFVIMSFAISNSTTYY